MDGLVVHLALHFRLPDLQALGQTSRLFRQAVQALPAHAWRCSAARTVPAYHPLAAAAAAVPATADSFCTAAAAITSGTIVSQPCSFAGAEALLLEPDFTR